MEAANRAASAAPVVRQGARGKAQAMQRRDSIEANCLWAFLLD